MNVGIFTEKLKLKEVTSFDGEDRGVDTIYAGDLLSWVMGRAPENCAWITVLTSINIIAVATLADVSCVIIPEGIEMEEATIKRANDREVRIFTTEMDAYQICWKGHELLEGGI